MTIELAIIAAEIIELQLLEEEIIELTIELQLSTILY